MAALAGLKPTSIVQLATLGSNRPCWTGFESRESH